MSRETSHEKRGSPNSIPDYSYLSMQPGRTGKGKDECAPPPLNYPRLLDLNMGRAHCQGGPLPKHLVPIFIRTKTFSPIPWPSGCGGLWVRAYLDAPFKIRYHPLMRLCKGQHYSFTKE